MLEIEICVDVPDLARGVCFYEDAFGFSKVSERRCQSNADLSMRCTTYRRVIDDLRCKCAPLGQCGRASLLVDLPGDEMPLLIEMVVDLGVN